MSKLYLFIFSVLFLAIFPLVVEAAEPLRPAFIGPMRHGKGPDPVHFEAVKAYASTLPAGLQLFCDPEVDTSSFEVHDDAAEGGLEYYRAVQVCRYLRTLGFKVEIRDFALTETEILKYVSPSSRDLLRKSQKNPKSGKMEKGFRGVMIYPKDVRCTDEDFRKAFIVYDETHKVVRPKKDFQVIDRNLPVGYEDVVVELSFKPIESEEEFAGEKVTRDRASNKKCSLAARKGATARTAEKPTSRVVPPAPVAPPKETKCSDGIDNDKDGLTDCADPDCEGSAVCGPEDTDARCNDKVDNDGDGFVDCEDKDCSPFCPEPVIPSRKERNCSDKIDNDGDGLTDCEDPDCQGIFSSCSKFKFFVSGELRFGILDKTTSGPFQGVEEVTDQIRTSDMFNGALTLGAYYPIKNGWSVGLELGGVTATNLYAFMGDTTLRGNVHQKKFLVRGGVLKQLNEDFAVGFQLGSYLDGDGYVPVGRVSLQIGLTKNLKFEVSGAVENTRHVQDRSNVWTFQLGAGFVIWF